MYYRIYRENNQVKETINQSKKINKKVYLTILIDYNTPTPTEKSKRT